MKNHVKFISYDGKYPNLCRGVLILNIDGKNYSFGYNWNKETDFTCFWYSGGTCGFNSDYSESFVETGSWEIDKLRLPEQFHEYTDEIYEVMNENMELPCCGGCL